MCVCVCLCTCMCVCVSEVCVGGGLVHARVPQLLEALSGHITQNLDGQESFFALPLPSTPGVEYLASPSRAAMMLQARARRPMCIRAHGVVRVRT